MSIDKVKLYLTKFGKDKDIKEFDVSTATVDLAAEALGIIPARIAKSIAVKGGEEGDILVVAAGDAKLDNKKFREEFGLKPKMLSFEETERSTGYKVGGVCPFDLPEKLNVVLDESLKRFYTVYPACGTSNSAVEMTISDLEETIPGYSWVDVCKSWDENLK